MKHEPLHPESGDPKPIKIFYCYAPEDNIQRDRLASHLEPLRRRGLIMPWHDQEIPAGKEWLRETYLHLDSSDIVLVLVSPAFMSSTYCTDIVMQHARERQLIGSLRIIPVLLRYISWKETFLGNLQALPRNEKPITDWRPVDRGFQEVAEEIEAAVHELRQSKVLRDQQASRRALERGIDLFDLAAKNPAYYQEALECFQQSLQLNDDHLDAWVGLAYALTQMGQLEDCLLACNYFLEHDTEADIDTLAVLRYKYHILLTQGRIAEAEEIARKVLEELPDSLRPEKRFVGFLSEEDEEEFPSLREGERELPRLARDEQQEIIIVAQVRYSRDRSRNGL
jgi:tetratricopeptide (TPR) repeat protein